MAKQFSNIPHAILILVLTQGLSSLGSSLTSFSLDIWVYKKTGSYAIFALIAVCSALPNLIFSPVSGVLSDRYQKKLILIVCEGCSLLGIIFVLTPTMLNHLSVSYVAVAIITLALAETLRWPTLSAVVSTLTPTKQLDRVNSLIEACLGIAAISGPLFGALALHWLGLRYILIFDALTFLVCILIIPLLPLTIIIQKITQYKKNITKALADFLKDCFFGFQWISKQQELLYVLLFFIFINFSLAIFWVIYTPYVLSFSSTSVLGLCLTLEGTGMFLGGLLFSIFGGFKQKKNGIRFGALQAGICMAALGCLHKPSLIYPIAFIHGSSIPMMNASNQTLWQSIVPIAYQGRVFSIRKMLAWSINPIAVLISIPLLKVIFIPIALAMGKTGKTEAFGLLISTLGSICAIVTVIIFIRSKFRGITSHPALIDKKVL